MIAIKTISVVFIALVQIVLGNKESFSQPSPVVCSGMYSQEDWGGSIQPYIEVTLTKGQKVSVVVFNYHDIDFLRQSPERLEFKICTEEAIRENLCNSDHIGQFIVKDSHKDEETGEERKPRNEIQTFILSEGNNTNVPKYMVKSTSFYCVVTISENEEKYNGVVDFRNTFGHLPATEINKLPLYGLLAIAYVVAMALYSFAVWKHKHELLLLQKYVLAFFVFLTIDTIFIWFYYDIRNEKGSTTGTNLFLVFVSILNAAKVSFSFFFLLVISLGYGIVYPKLNRKLMRRIQFFTLGNFGISVAFLIQNYLTKPESKTILPLITFIPLIVSIIAFYFMIVKSLGHTMVYLQEQRQIVKLKMYQKFLVVIYVSLVATVFGLFIISFVTIGMNTDDMIEQYWRTAFITDFWPSLVGYSVFVVLAFMWRPTDTSYMLACSQQLPTNPENLTDFDLDDLHSLGEDGFGNHEHDAAGPNNHQVHDDDLNFSDDELPTRHQQHVSK